MTKKKPDKYDKINAMFKTGKRHYVYIDSLELEIFA